MKAFKGFNKDMTCRGFQYEEGKTYEEKQARLCNSGFHVCEDPLDCLGYYSPAQSVYREVELDEVSEETEKDSKRVGRKIRIGAEIDIAGIVKGHFDYVKERTTIAVEKGDAEAATAGYSGAATAGEYGAATAGEYGAATAGNRGAATSRGSSASGENGLSVARGNGVKVKGGLGAILVIAEEDDNFNIVAWKAVEVDGEIIKADTWYRLEDGELKEIKE